MVIIKRLMLKGSGELAPVRHGIVTTSVSYPASIRQHLFNKTLNHELFQQTASNTT